MTHQPHVSPVVRSVFRASRIQALTLLKGPSFWMVVIAVVGLAATIQACVPIGLSGSGLGGTTAHDELLRILFVLSGLLVVLQADAWSWLYRGRSSTALAAQTSLTALYLHVIGAATAGAAMGLIASTPPAVHPHLALAESAWIAGLAGLLALPRLRGGGRALLFLILSWGIPSAVAATDPILALRSTHRVSELEGPVAILSMMVPHLLAFGYTRLQRARR